MRKKGFTRFVLVILFIVSTSADAITSGGSRRTIEAERWLVGLASDWSMHTVTRIDNRELKSDMRRVSGFVKFQYGLTDLFNFYGVIGAGTLSLEDRRGAPRTSRKSDAGLLWGGGAVYRLYLFANGGEMDIESSYLRQRNNQFSNITGTQNTLLETWQGQITASQPHGRFIPYFGVKYSFLSINIDRDLNESFRQDSPDYWGIVLGSRFDINAHLKLYAEGRLIDETAASLGMYWLFP